ncbi:hypothetical protein AgCh_016657 [Apium graveolens]
MKREALERLTTGRALNKGAHLPGWDWNNIADDSNESAFIDGVSKHIFQLLTNDGPLDLGENLVGWILAQQK